MVGGCCKTLIVGMHPGASGIHMVELHRHMRMHRGASLQFYRQIISSATPSTLVDDMADFVGQLQIRVNS